MNIETFEDLVDRFGEFPADWPEDIREEAIKFLEGSPEAQDFVAKAAALREMFDGSVTEKAPAALAGRIVALASRADEWGPLPGAESPATAAAMPSASLVSNSRRWPNSYIWLACCFVAGLGVGLGLSFSSTITGSHIDFATLFALSAADGC